MFGQLARVTFDLLLLRSGPQDMPSDWSLLGSLGILYAGLAFVQVQTVASPGSAFVQAALATVLLVAYVHAIVRMRAVPARFVQTLSAIFAAGIVFTVLMLGPTSALAPFLEALAQGQDPESVAQPSGFVLLAYLVIGLWGLVVFGHIYRHALDVSLGLGIGAAVVFEFILFMVFSLIGSSAG